MLGSNHFNWITGNLELNRKKSLRMEPVTNYCAAILGENREAMSAIRLIPELGGCSDDLLEIIYTYSKTVDTDPGEVLIQEGMYDQWVYFVINGTLDVLIAGENLGSTQGPIVGERCILGEPRGADLVAGKEGLMAFGVELSIIDELYRDINNFQQTASSDEEAKAYANNRMGVALELYSIILDDVLSRIASLYDSGKKGARHLENTSDSHTVVTRELFEFSGNKEDSDNSENTRTQKQFLLYSFNDFSEIVYYELLQKHLSHLGFEHFPLEEWKKRFTNGASGKVFTRDTFDWLGSDLEIPNADLVDITMTIFEVASQYTATSNKALKDVFSAFEAEEDRAQAREQAANQKQNRISDEIIQKIREDLFDPMEAGRRSTGENNTDQPASGKMDQADIDALFG